MSDHVDSVKAILRLFGSWQTNAIAKGDDKQASVYENRIHHIQAVLDELEELRRVLKPIPASYGDLSDLPPELVKELTGIKVDDLEQQIFTVVKAGGSEVDLDSILIELFRRFKVVQTRKFLQNKLWRMAQKGVIQTVPGRKGVYTAQPVSASTKPSTNGFLDDLDDDVPF